MHARCPFAQQRLRSVPGIQSIDNRQSSGQSTKTRFPHKQSHRMRGCVSLLFIAVCWVRAGGPEWSGSRVRLVRRFTPQHVCLSVKKMSAVLLCFAVRDIAGAMPRLYIHTSDDTLLYARKHWRPRRQPFVWTRRMDRNPREL